MKNAIKISLFIISILFFAADTQAQVKSAAPVKITFIELGSVSCIPCKKMQPVMKSIEKKYGSQIKVVFHDVNKDKKYVEQYAVRLIPTQVFLDEKGKEIFRHEGFFPEAGIDKFLQSKGLKILSNDKEKQS